MPDTHEPLPHTQITDVQASTSAYVWGPYRSQTILVICVSIGVLLASIFFFLFYSNHSIDAAKGFAFPFVIMVVIGSALYLHIKNKVQDEFMRQFATANGYDYAESGTTDGLLGRLFKVGHSQHVSDVVSGTYQNYPLRLLTFQYTVGYGKYSHTCNIMAFEVTFDTKLPDIMLLAHEQHFDLGIGIFFALPSNIRLESNLENVFSLSTQKEYEIEALQIFTPELLAHLVALPKHYSLEFVDNKLYIYSDDIIGTSADLNAIYAVAQELSVHLGPFLGRLKDDVEAMDEFYKPEK